MHCPLIGATLRTLLPKSTLSLEQSFSPSTRRHADCLPSLNKLLRTTDSGYFPQGAPKYSFHIPAVLHDFYVLPSELLHVRFPWQLDVGALSRNNGIVQHCCVSLATQQLKRRAYQQQHCYARNNRHRDVIMVFGILLT
jgi:hypothetical protein